MQSTQKELTPVSNRLSLRNNLKVTHSIRPRTKEVTRTENNATAEFFEVYKVFQSSGMFSILNVQLVPLRQLFVAGKLRVQLQLTQDYVRHFALLNGLLGFGKTQGTLIEIQKETRSFVVTISMDNDYEAAQYFENVFNLFQKELGFKKTLRVVLATERKIREELNQVYQAQFEAL